MPLQDLKITWIDSRKDDIKAAMARLREKLSPRGEIVSQEGRQRTIEIFGEPLSPSEVVRRICRDVEQKGLEAVLDYSARIDHAELAPQTIRVPQAELDEAHAKADPEFLAAVRQVRENIADFQRAILHRDVRIDRPDGYLVERYLPLARVGVCVPGGAAAYPSTVLMTAVPAQVAGVKQLAVVAPPTRFGAYNHDMLATCRELGIDEVYRLGGAQAVAALAYGVEGLPRVDKIVGPGNLFVALAKKHVYGDVAIDSIAGPSEVVVIVDQSTRADYTAYDLLAQAEHAPGASILIGWDEPALRAAVGEVARRIDQVERGQLARQSLEDFGAVILARDADEACQLADQIAPEHLHVATENAPELARKIQHAGAVFLGNYAPVALGDYAAGPSHVLPTSGTARFASGLSANDFLRSSSLIHFDREGIRRLAPAVRILATKEGLTAHRASVEIRLAEPDPGKRGMTNVENQMPKE
ncbi:MAG: histidinol dehydrogenase [Pirellulaceae bacterium]|jgi:histidinol dehydrogenase|nr:histidinol dehydrogenase [Pirellulaceae bacterium]